MRHFWESARYVSAWRNSVFRLPLANRIRTIRCGGTVTVRFRFSFYPRFGGLFFFFFPCFFSLALVTWGGTKRERRDRVAGCAKGVNRTTWLPRAMHVGVDSPGDLHATRYSQKRNFTEVIFIGITQLLLCMSHNSRDGGDHCWMNILSLHYATHFLSFSLSFFPETLIYA